MTLDAILESQITRTGPLNMAEFMSLCLYHPEYGYYRQERPIGAEGDFVTAPEISQMFGELIGLALAQAWLDQGSPKAFNLVELGPGRGQLMADILRATKDVPNFHTAASLHLIESSAALRDIQKRALDAFAPTWHETLDNLPDGPIFFVANEFFDCLPIRQFIATDTHWVERMVGWDSGPIFVQGTSQLAQSLGPTTDAPTWLELRPAANAIAQDLAKRVQQDGGAGLIIDYGAWGSDANTLQAVKAHQKSDPLRDLGKSDLTAHVDFAALSKAMDAIARSELTPQGVFLERLGITQRAQTLAGTLNGDALVAHIEAHRRLTHPEEMGNLFKVLGIWHSDAEPIAGLS